MKVIVNPNQLPKAQFGQMEGYACLREAPASHMEALASLRKTPASLMEALANSSLGRRVKISPSHPLKAQACLREG